MKSIFSILLAALMLPAILTGCGSRSDKNNAMTANPAPTTAAAATTAPNAADKGSLPGAAENAVDRVENGAMNAVDDMKDGVDDLLGDDGAINGDMNDGMIEDGDGKTEGDGPKVTPQAR